MSKDTITTILGAGIAVATSVEPAISAANGTFDTSDITKIVIAIVTALLGFFTNKPETTTP